MELSAVLSESQLLQRMFEGPARYTVQSFMEENSLLVYGCVRNHLLLTQLLLHFSSTITGTLVSGPVPAKEIRH